MRLDQDGGGIILEGGPEVTGLYSDLFALLGDDGPANLQRVQPNDEPVDPTDHASAVEVKEVYYRVMSVTDGEFPVSSSELAGIAHWLGQTDTRFSLLSKMVELLPPEPRS